MKFEEFKTIVELAKRKNPIWFELERDPPASASDIRNAESSLATHFPESYREFLQEYGGGQFAFTTIFSTQANSEWNVVDRNHDLRCNDASFLAISDNGAGDCYGFKIVDGLCESSIAFWDHEERGRISATRFRDMYEFIVAIGLRME